MFCKYCGTKLVDTAAFCYECGKATNEQPVPPAQPVYQQPVYQQTVPPVPPVYQQSVYQQPAYQPPVPPVQPVYQPPVQPVYPQNVQPAADPEQLEKLHKQTLTLGILGLCLSMLGLPGLILSCIAAKKAGVYKKLTGKVDGKALIGYRLAKAGRAVGIVMTILLFIIVNVMISDSGSYYSDPYNFY